MAVYLLAVLGFVFYYAYTQYQAYLAKTNLQNLATLMTPVAETTQPTTDKSESDNAQLTDPSEPYEGKSILPQFATLFQINPDFYAWLKIEGTQLDYPVMYTPADGDYYLYRDFQKKDSKYGLPFIDYHASVIPRSTNLLIHGHNMKDGSMFATLAKYQSRAFFDEHPIVEFDTLYETGDYEIFAAFLTEIFPDDGEDFLYYQFINADTEAEFNDYVENALRLSLYDTKIRPTFGDELLTLSTCSYQVSDGRMVVVARKIVQPDLDATS